MPPNKQFANNVLESAEDCGSGSFAAPPFSVIAFCRMSAFAQRFGFDCA